MPYIPALVVFNLRVHLELNLKLELFTSYYPILCRIHIHRNWELHY
jgi:hypothetical protein